MASVDAYSPLKSLRHLDVIDGVRRGVPVRPVHVQVILSDLCNQACNFCAYRDPGYTSSTLFRVLEPGKKGLRRAGHEGYNFNPNRMIPTEKVMEILDDCRAMGVQAIQYTGGGEPTVHPDFTDIVEHTIARGLKWSLVTNGVNISRAALEDWVNAAAWVRISLDAATAETYARVRNVPDWHWREALQAIPRIRAARELLGVGPVIGVGFVVTPDNWREVYDAAVLVKHLGADNIRIGAQFSANDEHLFSGFHAEAAELCRQAEALTGDGFTVHNRFGEKLADLRQKSPDYQRCGYQSFTTYIGADLNLYRCCVFAYHPRGLYGSIKDRRFRDAWMGAERVADMAAFDARGCDRCQFNGINRVLDYTLRADEPAHSEFV